MQAHALHGTLLPSSEENYSAFHRWFGNSKVVSPQGVPEIVFHGTQVDIRAFRSSPWGSFGSGIYFADAEAADCYSGSGEGSIIIPVFLSLQNPLFCIADYDAGEEVDFDSPAVPLIRLLWGKEAPERIIQARNGSAVFGSDVQQKAEALGHDGLVMTYPDGCREYVAFYPRQVKSAIGNNGNFDSKHDHICG